MRIVYLLGMFELVGGQEYFLARNQARQGHDVFIVTSDRWYTFPNLRRRYEQEGFTAEQMDHRAGRWLEYDGLKIYRLPTVFSYQDFTMVRGVREILEKVRPDVVFAHEPKTIVPMMGAWYKNKLGYAYFVDTHDFFHKIQNHVWWQRWLRYIEYFWWRRWFVDYALRKADKIIPVAQECQKFLEDRHGIHDHRMEYLPLGVDTDFFQYNPEVRQATRQELGYRSDDIVLLFSGYMFRRKALESLIDLIASIKDIPLQMLFLGEGPTDYLAELQQQAKDRGVADKVTFPGFVPYRKLRAYYCAADIGIWPGNNSLVILEAMACRLPIIMADMQLAHLVSHENGFKVPYADVGAMDQKIRQLAASPALRSRMGTASEQAAKEHYSYAMLARRVSNWMEQSLRS